MDNFTAALALVQWTSVRPIEFSGLPDQTRSGTIRACCSRASERHIAVIVDYAHTPDALEKTLAKLKEMTTGQLWALFGCGGDRDSGKRPLMGKIAEEQADIIVVTSDNPRTEKPEFHHRANSKRHASEENCARNRRQARSDCFRVFECQARR